MKIIYVLLAIVLVGIGAAVYALQDTRHPGESIVAVPTPTPVPTPAIGPDPVTRLEFEQYRYEQQRRYNDLLDVLDLTVAELKKSKAKIKELEGNQGALFSVQEDLRLRFEMLSGKYKRIDLDGDSTNQIILNPEKY